MAHGRFYAVVDWGDETSFLVPFSPGHTSYSSLVFRLIQLQKWLLYTSHITDPPLSAPEIQNR